MEARRQVLKSLAAAVGLGLAAGRGSAMTAAARIRMAYADKYGPLSMLGGDGAVGGLLVDGVNMIGRDCEFEFENAAYPWARAQLMLRQGDADGICTVPTEERRTYALFCATPIVSVKYGILHRADDLRVLQVRSVRDLRRFRQGSYRGSGYSVQYLEYDRIRLDNDPGSVLRRIAMNDLDTFVESEIAVTDRLKEAGLADKIRFTPLPFLPAADFCFGLRRSFADAESVVLKMELACKAAEKSGSLGALRKRYGLRAA